MSFLKFLNALLILSWKSFHWRQSFSDILFGEFERLTVEREFSLLLFLYSEHCRQFLDAIAPLINQSLLLDRWLTQCKVTVSPGCMISTCSNVHLPEGRQPAVKKAEAGSPLTPPVKTLLLVYPPCRGKSGRVSCSPPKLEYKNGSSKIQIGAIWNLRCFALTTLI